MDETQLEILAKLEDGNAITVDDIAIYRNGDKIDHLEGASTQEIIFFMLQTSVKDSYTVKIDFNKNPSREVDWEKFESK